MDLKTYLKKESMSQRKFAKKSGLSYNSVYRYVNGLRVPDAKSLQKIYSASSGAVRPEDFFDFDPAVAGEK